MIEGEKHVVVVGRQELAREGMRRILSDEGFRVRAIPTDEFEESGVACDAPDLIIVEADTAEEGIDICTLLRAAVPSARIALISGQCDLASISRAFNAGIDGYLNNTIACQPLLGALKLILMGEKIVPTQIVSELTSISSLSARPNIWDMKDKDVNLSERETQILWQLVRGEANKVISRHLAISEATVKVHVKAILRKLHVLNRTQAAIWAVNRGMIGNGPNTVTSLAA